MPVSKSRKPRARKPQAAAPARARLAAVATGFGAASMLVWGCAVGQVGPRIPATALPSGPVGQPLVPGTNLRQPQILGGRFDPYQVSGNTAIVTQKDAAGILRWGSFDIGAAAAVRIDQPSSSAVLLNKVDGGAFENKTVIEGLLSGNGQVYIYNPNGVIFGKTSEVNLNSLVATSLNIDNARFLNGILSPAETAIFSASGSARPGNVVVEGEAGQQARISAARGGRILLVGPSVSNSGILSAPDGQVALAAGGRVYLASPDGSDLRMRGLLIEVNNANLTGGAGAATNEALGRILVERGNASLAGMAVNQMGSISATTSVAQNGSIFLRAGATTKISKLATERLEADVGGALVLGPGSRTEIMPTLEDSGTGAAASFNKSWANLRGDTIRLQSDARISAPGGDVELIARANPVLASAGGSSRIQVEAGATIDVAGTTSTRLAMESNVIEVELRGSELADFPANRDSAIRGTKARVDIRAADGRGTRVANVQGYLGLVGRSVGDLTASGGTVTLRSDGAVVLAETSRIDVSGGKVTYEDGHVRTSQLTSQGRTYDIGSAAADRVYDGSFIADASARNFESGYTEGRSAGSIRLDATNVVLKGSIAGGATPGERQRDVTLASHPKGGELVIGNPDTEGALARLDDFHFNGQVVFGGTATAGLAAPAFGTNLPQAFRDGVDVDPSLLAAGGISRVRAYTQGGIDVQRTIELKPGGELNLAARNAIRFDAGVIAPGGAVTATSAESSITVSGADPARPPVEFDLAGRWTNDRDAGTLRDARGNPVAAIVGKGGSITFDARSIDIGAAAKFDVSGGAWQNTAGKISGGVGGGITIDVRPESNLDPLAARLTLASNVDFRGYGLGTGGTLRLTGRNAQIGAAAGDARDLWFAADFFRSGGFSRFDIRANGNLTLASNTALAPTMDLWWQSRSTASKPGGTMGSAFTRMSLAFPEEFAQNRLPLVGAWGSRQSTGLTLAATSERLGDLGRLWLQSGSSITLDAGGAVNLSAGRQIVLNGNITARGGSIGMAITPAVTDDLAYFAERGVWLAGLLDARGSADRIWNGATTGRDNGDLLGGGTVRIGRTDSNGRFGALPGHVVLEPGAAIKVDGIDTTLTLTQGRGSVTTTSIASAGGAIDIRARESVLLGGAVTGAGGTGAAGGSLTVVLDRENVNGNPATYPAGPRNLVVGNSMPDISGLKPETGVAGFEATGRVLAGTVSNGGFDSVQLKSQDLLSFDLAAGSLALSPRAALTLDAPLFAASGGLAAGGIATLSAPYVQLGNTDWRYQTGGNTPGASVLATPSARGASFGLQVNATTIDLMGASALQGFNSANFSAAGDIRLIGRVPVDLAVVPVAGPTAISAAGSFSFAGDASFSARQIYPSTLSSFTLNARHFTDKDGVVLGIELGAPAQQARMLADGLHVAGASTACVDCVEVRGSITFNSNGAAPDMPLSAAGSLTVNARDIHQNGVVRAPFGAIHLSATDRLTFGATSLTSAAGAGAIPLGRISNGRDWLYDYGNGNTVSFTDKTALNYVGLPEKSVVSAGKSISVAAGAKIDASGGGDLYGYEFTPGPLGSSNVLAKSASQAAATTFAILPGYTGEVAPADFQYGQDGGLKPGDRIFLTRTQIPGLAEGFYTLLPAHYALLDGAFVVSPVANTRDMSAADNAVRADGSWLVAGRRASSVAVDSRFSGFQVLSGSQARQRSEFGDFSGNQFLSSALASLPRDGGRVAFAATESLALGGQTSLGADTGGRRGMADISAPAITIVANRAQDTGASLKLVASELMALGADSLLIGGVRDVRAAATHIAVGAQRVTVDNQGTNGALVGPEIILAASDTVEVKSGSVIGGAGVPGRSAGTLTLDGRIVDGKVAPGVAVSGAEADGALLRVSGGGQAGIVRNAPPGVTGTLDIQSGSTVGASGSITLDATKSLLSAGQFDFGSGAAFSLGASRISLGDAIPDLPLSDPNRVDGLKFDRNALAALGNVANLALTSYSTIDTYGRVDLGNLLVRRDAQGEALRDAGGNVLADASIRDLTLRAAGIQAYDGSVTGDRQVNLVAGSVRFEGGTNFVTRTPVTGAAQGALTVLARDILVGSDKFDIRGVGAVKLNAAGQVVADGKAGVLASAGDMSIAAGRITAAGGKDGGFAPTGNLLLTQPSAVTLLPAATGGSPTPTGLGGRLTFSGTGIEATDAQIAANAGEIRMKADNGLILNGGRLDASGASITFGSGVAYAPAGRIGLDGGIGNVQMGAAIDLSATGADAGTLEIKASAGTVSLDGTLRAFATAAPGGAAPGQGGFSLDVGSLTGLGALNAKLDAAGDGVAPGFAANRQFRVRSGDVALTAGERIAAHDVLVSVDSGNLVVGGTIDARGPKGGAIQLFAAQPNASGASGNVVVQNTAQLLASATTAATGAAGSSGDGGRVIIGSAAGNGAAPTAVTGGSGIVIQAAGVDPASGQALRATIDVAGSGAGESGTVTLRAPRVAADVAVSGLGNLDRWGNPDGNGNRTTAETVVEAYKVYNATGITAANGSATNLDARTSGLMFTEAGALAANKAAILGRLGADADVKLRAGIEVRSANDLSVSVNESAAANARSGRGWNLQPWRFGGEPIGLTLRAQGNLTINGSISDGFVSGAAGIAMPNWALDPSGGASASYRLTGGADLAAANPLEVRRSSDSGDVKIAFVRTTDTATDRPVAMLRTGSGRIDIAAGRDFVLDSLFADTENPLGATLYTAGRATAVVSGFTAPRSQTTNAQYGTSGATTAQFASGGGAISVDAGRDVKGAPTAQLINNWLFRRGRTTTDAAGNTVFDTPSATNTEVLQTAWWSRYDHFNQGIATFAGGDISVRAATGDISDLSVSAATNGQVASDANRRPLALTERGGGDVSVAAGGDILGGSTYVQKGSAALRAAGSLLAGSRTVEDATLGTIPLRPVLALGDGSVSVTAGGDLQIESVFNPTFTRQSSVNAAVRSSSAFPAHYGYFSTYSPTSAVRLTALSGNLLLGNNAQSIGTASGAVIRSGLDSSFGSEALYSQNYLLYPGSLTAAALGGNIAFEHGMSLAPASAGQLELLARGSIRSQFPRNAEGKLFGDVQPIVMLDRDPAAVPGVLRPGTLTDNDFTIMRGAGNDGLPYHTSGGLHAGDTQAARVVALTGDIQGENYIGNGGLFKETISLPKRAEIIAGRDLRDFGFRIQHLNPADVSIVRAGRDIADTTDPNASGVTRHTVSGPGFVDIAAGRDVDLGNSEGVSTRGNLDNPYLAEGGAAIVVTAGAKADYVGFARSQLAPGDLPVADQEALKDYVRARTGLPVGSDVAAAWAAFGGLPAADQAAFLEARKPLLNQIYFNRLASSTGAISGGALDLARFDAIIESLFPLTSVGGGNINVFGSQLKTEQGGSIDIFAPGGSVFAGLVNVPAYLTGKSASDLGLFTIRGGALNAQVKQNFLVNQGRVFTLGGGDITLASQFGNIDAGRGAKTAVSAPPPVLRTDKDGNIVVDISGSISGSGIATLQTSSAVAPSNVYPIAPRGIFDAGDAGVRSSGTVSVVAATVLNAGNITAGGSVSGAKTADTGGLGGAVAAPAAVTPTKTDNFAGAGNPNPEGATNLTVELLGFGGTSSAARCEGGGSQVEAGCEGGASGDAAPQPKPKP